MPRLTRKSITGWQRQAVHLAHYIKICSTTDTWRRAQRSCIEPTSLSPSYIWLSCESLTSTAYDSWMVPPVVSLHHPFNIYWSDFITNTEVLGKVKITNIEDVLLKSMLPWAGHISRMRNHHLPKIILWGELSNHCNKGIKEAIQGLLEKSFWCLSYWP